MFHKIPDKSPAWEAQAVCIFRTICCNPSRTCWRKLLRYPRCLLASRRAEHDVASPQFTALAIQNCTSVSETAAILWSLQRHTHTHTQINATMLFLGRGGLFLERSADLHIWTMQLQKCVSHSRKRRRVKSIIMMPFVQSLRWQGL